MPPKLIGQAAHNKKKKQTTRGRRAEMETMDEPQKKFSYIKKDKNNDNGTETPKDRWVYGTKYGALLHCIEKTIEDLEEEKLEEILQNLYQDKDVEVIYLLEEIPQKGSNDTVNQTAEKKKTQTPVTRKRKADEVFADGELENENNQENLKQRKIEETKSVLEKKSYEPTLLDEIFQAELDYYESNRPRKDYRHARYIFERLARKGHAPSKFLVSFRFFCFSF